MADAKTTAKKESPKEKASSPYVPLKSFESAVGSFTEGELAYLHDSEQVKGLVEGGYLLPQDEYLEQTDEGTLNEMEREQGVSARESGSQPAK